MPKKKAKAAQSTVEGSQALTLHRLIASLLREFKLEPGLLAGSIYADLHVNDIGLFELLGSGDEWTVNRIANTLRAPITTISSALDRLERRGLIARKRNVEDRRVVRLELTTDGRRVAERLEEAHIQNCAKMLARLPPQEREEFLRLAALVAKQ